MKRAIAEQVAKLGTIMSFGAHPDDETFTAAGLLHIAATHGQRVICVTATKGERGVQDESRWPAAQLAEIRATELQQALSILGIQHHHWLGYQDEACADVSMAEVTPRIKELIKKYRPDTIVTFGPDGMTGHPDHRAVSRWVTAAVDSMEHQPAVYHAVVTQEQYDQHLKTMDSELNMFFNIDHPPIKPVQDCDLCITLPDEVCKKKCQALAAMPSQTSGMFDAFGETVVCVAFCQEAFVRAK